MKHSFSKFIRLVWIDLKLEMGTINRGDISAAFGMSTQQASIDLKAYQTDHPDRIEYDHRARAYQRPRRAKPAYPKHLRLLVQATVHAVSLHREDDTQ